MAIEHDIPGDFLLQLSGLVPDGERHARRFLYDELETRLPRGPEARINVNLSQLNPGQTPSWHLHNGVVLFLVVQGIVTLQYEHHSEHYRTGQVYTEPIGVVHRAFNPDDSIPAVFVGFWVTEADRPHVAEVDRPTWVPAFEAHPGAREGHHAEPV